MDGARSGSKRDDLSEPSAAFTRCMPEQEGLWILEQARDIGVANQLTVAIRLSGPLDGQALRDALQAIVLRHPALRTEYVFRDGGLHGRLLEQPASHLPDVPTISATEAELPEVFSRLTRARLDPLRWPPFKATLIRLDEHEHVLFAVFHHALFDGLSRIIFFREVGELYPAHAGIDPGGSASATDTVPFPDDPLWYEREMRRLAPAAAAHWTEQLPKLPSIVGLPTFPMVRSEPPEPEMLTFEVDRSVLGAIEQLAAAQGPSPFIVLLTALQELQHRYGAHSATGDIATSVAMDMRPTSHRGRIGMYANEAPLICHRADDDRAFVDHLTSVTTACRELFALRSFPFTVAASRWGRELDVRSLIPEVGISYVRLTGRRIDLGDVTAELMPYPPAYGSRRPIMLYLSHLPGHMDGRLKFDPDIVPVSAAEGIVRQYLHLLGTVVTRPRRPPATAALVTKREERALLTAWSRSAAEQPAPDTTIQAVVERRVEETPHAPALEMHGVQVSYSELNARANQLARRLRDCHIEPDTAVAVYASRSPDLVVGLLAVLKAGGAYLPLDPAYPPTRLRRMLSVGAPRALLLHESLPALGTPQPAAVIALNEPRGDSEANPTPFAGPDDLAYVLFTSGSTGVPKAVAMPLRPLSNLLLWQCRSFALGGPRRVLQFASAGFDVSIVEMLSTLMTGGCIVLIDEETRRDPNLLATLLLTGGIERMFVPPVVLAKVAQSLATMGTASGPMEAIAAGEQLEITRSIRAVWGRNAGWTLENQYGPTESHVVTRHLLGGDADSWPSLPPIGRPIPSARIYILDRFRRPLPTGVPGELCIGGPVLARGYLGQSALTAERFVEDPFHRGQWMYRTGDLASWRPDRAIQYLGRVDRQVKIRGHRVEPGEIEAALTDLAEVREAAVEAQASDHARPARLVAYVVAHDSTRPTPRALRAHLMETLPSFMVPSAFVFLDRLPLTANGKLDRAALPQVVASDLREEPGREPASQPERVIAAIWAQLLEVERVGADDDFFELGGDSMLAAEAMARARAALGVELPLRVLFANPTVAGLAVAATR